MKLYKLVIFDLDGTLVNTIDDLAAATNQALSTLGFPTHTAEAYRYKVGNGVMKLFERALPEAERTPYNIERVRDLFMPYYRQHDRDKSRPYDGIPQLLEALTAGGVAVAVASNKFEAAVIELMHFYFPDIRFAAVCGQVDTRPVKPHPAIVHHILAATGIPASEVLYVGDSNVDMQTALRSGVTACGVTWGFRTRKELEAESPAFVVDTPAEVLSIVAEGKKDRF